MLRFSYQSISNFDNTGFGLIARPEKNIEEATIFNIAPVGDDVWSSLKKHVVKTDSFTVHVVLYQII